MSSEVITRTDLTNILNEVLPPDGVDYMIEQGTSGEWIFRKWNSGAVELWWEKGYSVAANTVNISNYAVYPFAVHGSSGTNAPIVTCGLKGGGADLYRFHVESSSTTTTQARLVLINKHTAAVTMIPQLYIRGFWK